MNKTIEDFARATIKKKLALHSEGSQHRFKQMYAKGNFELSIGEVVDQMSAEKLDWALQQVENTKLPKAEGGADEG